MTDSLEQLEMIAMFFRTAVLKLFSLQAYYSCQKEYHTYTIQGAVETPRFYKLIEKTWQISLKTYCVNQKVHYMLFVGTTLCPILHM